MVSSLKFSPGSYSRERSSVAMSLDDEDEGGFERRGLDVSALSEIGGSVRGGVTHQRLEHVHVDRGARSAFGD